jgi:hypothetical protein
MTDIDEPIYVQLKMKVKVIKSSWLCRDFFSLWQVFSHLTWVISFYFRMLQNDFLDW